MAETIENKKISELEELTANLSDDLILVSHIDNDSKSRKSYKETLSTLTDNVTSSLSEKFVNVSERQSISGLKTFAVPPILSSNNIYQISDESLLVHKRYVDSIKFNIDSKFDLKVDKNQFPTEGEAGIIAVGNGLKITDLSILNNDSIVNVQPNYDLIDGVSAASISVGDDKFTIYSTSVDVEADLSSGKKLATIEINGDKTDIYTDKVEVEVKRIENSSLEIGSISVGDKVYHLSAPDMKEGIHLVGMIPDYTTGIFDKNTFTKLPGLSTFTYHGWKLNYDRILSIDLEEYEKELGDSELYYFVSPYLFDETNISYAMMRILQWIVDDKKPEGGYLSEDSYAVWWARDSNIDHNNSIGLFPVNARSRILLYAYSNSVVFPPGATTINWDKCGIDLYRVKDKAQYAVQKTARDIYVVKYYNADNNWYRLWSNGWCEQGGVVELYNGSRANEIKLIVPFINNKYEVQISRESPTNCGYPRDVGTIVKGSRTSQSFSYLGTCDNDHTIIHWEAKGYT